MDHKTCHIPFEGTVLTLEDSVTIPRDEYNLLIRARNGIDLIGSTIGRYGPNDAIALAVCKSFGYEYKEPCTEGTNAE